MVSATRQRLMRRHKGASPLVGLALAVFVVMLGLWII